MCPMRPLPMTTTRAGDDDEVDINRRDKTSVRDRGKMETDPRDSRGFMTRIGKRKDIGLGGLVVHEVV